MGGGGRGGAGLVRRAHVPAGVGGAEPSVHSRGCSRGYLALLGGQVFLAGLVSAAVAVGGVVGGAVGGAILSAGVSSFTGH